MSRKRQAESEPESDEEISSSEDSISSDSNSDSDDNSSSDDDSGLVNCDFEFFDPQKQDLLGIKHLLRQLFDRDTDLFDLEALTEMILAQPLVGSTVKTDGNEGDPLSFLTVLNLRVHKDKPVIQALIQYFLDKATSNKTFKDQLRALVDGEAEVGLVLAERIINMPAAVAAPSYKMLLEEIEWANEDKEPYQFTHLLILSRTYLQTEPGSGDDDDDEVVTKPRPKKQKRRTSSLEEEVQYFHPEDELFLKSAEKISFSYNSEASLEDENLKTSGLLLLIEKSQFDSAIGEMERYLGVGTNSSQHHVDTIHTGMTADSLRKVLNLKKHEKYAWRMGIASY